MEPPKQIDDGEDQFLDAFDDFDFIDCTPSDQSDKSTSISKDPIIDTPKYSDTPVRLTTFRRRSFSRHRVTGDDSKERRYKFYRMGSEGDNEEVSSVQAPSSVIEQNNEESTITTVNDDDRVGESADSSGELNESSSSVLLFVAGLVIKAIGFQINMFISLVTFPLWFMYQSYMLVIDPFGMMRIGREILKGKFWSVWDLIYDIVSPYVGEWLKGHESVWKFAFRLGWGLLWAVYVCIILCSLLVSSLLIGGFLMRYLVETPVQIRETLNFDYTKNSPIAVVPIIGCGGVGCGLQCTDMVDRKRLRSRVIPPNHKLHAIVSLMLPESKYNRNLGMFQVRVTFLSSDGKTLASSSQPCILQFKSEPIRLLLTFLELVPIVSGYSSESQKINVKINGFSEGDIPTSCLQVIIEQRAEYQPAAGIPEIYDASLLLESELPLFKKVIWYWKTTIFVWISMMSFGFLFLCTMVCCRPLIIPRSRPRDSSNGSNTLHNSLQAEN